MARFEVVVHPINDNDDGGLTASRGAVCFQAQSDDLAALMKEAGASAAAWVAAPDVEDPIAFDMHVVVNP